MNNNSNTYSIKIETQPHTFQSPKIINPDLWEKEQQRQSQLRKCGYCYKIFAPFRCSACHQTRYCNQGCQRKHWFIHKTECKILQQNNMQ